MSQLTLDAALSLVGQNNEPWLALTSLKAPTQYGLFAEREAV